MFFIESMLKKKNNKRINYAQIKCKLAVSRFFMLALCRLVSALSVQEKNQVLFYSMFWLFFYSKHTKKKRLNDANLQCLGFSC